MLDIWMRSIARAGGIEVPPDRYIVEPRAEPLPQSEPQLRTEWHFVNLMHWLKARFAPPASRCEV